MADIYKIYGIVNPKTDQVRYIGVTKNSLNRRLYEHRIDFIRTKKTCWIQSMVKNNITPKIILLEDNLCKHEAFKKEIEYILLYKSFGANLVNLTLGGECPPNMKGIPRTDETKQKISKSNKIAQLGKRIGLSNGKSVQVAQIDKSTNIVLSTFNSMASAIKLTGVSKSSIEKYLSGIRKYGGGYNWKIIPKEEYIKSNLKNINDHKLIPYHG